MLHYTQDNTQGYTQAQLDAFNDELRTILADACNSSNDTLTADDIDRIIKQHNDDIAHR